MKAALEQSSHADIFKQQLMQIMWQANQNSWIKGYFGSDWCSKFPICNKYAMQIETNNSNKIYLWKLCDQNKTKFNLNYNWQTQKEQKLNQIAIALKLTNCEWSNISSWRKIVTKRIMITNIDPFINCKLIQKSNHTTCKFQNLENSIGK